MATKKKAKKKAARKTKLIEVKVTGRQLNAFASAIARVGKANKLSQQQTAVAVSFIGQDLQNRLGLVHIGTEAY